MKTRKQTINGYALISIIVIGAFSLMFLLALATIVTDSVRAVSSNKYIESLRNAAETGIDYAVAKYNTELPICSLDPTFNPTSGGSKTTLLESTSPYLQSLPATSGSPGITVSITVYQLAANDWQALKQMSSVYSPQLDPNNAVSNGYASPASTIPLSVSGGGFRVLESTASNGILSRTIRVILKARLDTPPDSVNPPTLPNLSQASYFNIPMLSNQTLQVLPQGSALNIQGFNSQSQSVNPVHTVTPTLAGQASYTAYDLNIQTNQNAIFGSNGSSTGAIYGDVTVASTGAPGAVASTQNVAVEGRLNSAGAVDGNVSYSNGGQPLPGDTVKANADLLVNPQGTRVGQNVIAPVTQNQAIAQSPPAAANVPSSASTLSSLADIANAVQPTPDNPQPQPAALESGEYETQGLSTTGVNTSLSIPSSTLDPIKLFVTGTSATDPANVAVNLDTSKLTFANTDARDFQIFYEGSNQVNINLANQPFTGLVYAPNAQVTVSGNGIFNGALVAGQLNITMSGTMNLYTDLGSTTGPSGVANSDAGLQYQVQTSGGTVAQAVQGWQPITWQEFTAGVDF